MAEEMLFDLAGEIIKKLGSLALEEAATWCSVKDELRKLESTVSSIKAVLLDAEEKQMHNNQVKLWLGRLKDAMYDAEDLLDDFSTEALMRQVTSGNKITKEVRLFFSSSNQLAYSVNMVHKIKALRERLDAIAFEKDRYKLEFRPEENGPKMTREREQTDSFSPLVVVGREGDKRAVMKFLFDSNYEDNVSIISIVGIGGLGKTALAQHIFNDEQVNRQFDLKLWVCVSYSFNIDMVVNKMLDSAPKMKSEEHQLNTEKDSLRKTIRGKKYLIVLDDVWNEDGEKWDNLRRLLWDGAMGSKIMVTTRSVKVAELMSTAPPYKLGGLSEHESWHLFRIMAFRQGRTLTDSGLEAIGREIVRKCAGIPLAIKTVGRILYFKKSRAEWLFIKDNELFRVAQTENDILPTLKLSYDHLPRHLKPCFAYCSLFPKDYEFDVKTLIQLWIAQGFIESSLSSQSVEEIGLEYFMDLTWRAFFQEIKRDLFGNVSSCRMHDLMHDLAGLVAGSEFNVINSNEVDINQKVRHISFGFQLKSSGRIPGQICRATRLRTLIMPYQDRSGFGQCRWEKSSCEAIFSNFRPLRALGLPDSGIEKLPTSIEMLKHLRFLDLSGNRDIRLPNSICNLQNLQVLKLSNSWIGQLPKDLRKLINLRHLELDGCTSLKHMPPRLGQLTSLRTLTWFVVATDTRWASKHEIGGLEELNGLNNLRGSLVIRNLQGCVKKIRGGGDDGGSMPLEAEAANLRGKQHLESLTLNWGRTRFGYDWRQVNTDFEERTFQVLQPHPNLKALELKGYGGVRIPSWLSSLTSLVQIQMKNCKRHQHLPSLQHLPFLSKLKISGSSELEYIDNEREELSSSTFFPSLKILCLYRCKNLKGWRKTTAAQKLPQFPCLSRLELLGCPHLACLPLFPSLDDVLEIRSSSLEPLRQTMEMKMGTSSLASATSSSSSSKNVRPLSKLKELRLELIDDIESLPEDWLQHLTSLQRLVVVLCSNFKYMPQGMRHLASLQKLDIIGCPGLKERCGNEKGADWRNIAHIPNINIDFKQIQTEGRSVFDQNLSSLPWKHS